MDKVVNANPTNWDRIKFKLTVLKAILFSRNNHFLVCKIKIEEDSSAMGTQVYTNMAPSTLMYLLKQLQISAERHLSSELVKESLKNNSNSSL